MQFCRVDVCGYDAAVARFTATGDEGEALVAALEDPEALVEMIRGKPEPDKIKARVDVQPTTINEWKGVEIAIEGGKKERQAFGVALLRRGVEGCRRPRRRRRPSRPRPPHRRRRDRMIAAPGVIG